MQFLAGIEPRRSHKDSLLKTLFWTSQNDRRWSIIDGVITQDKGRRQYWFLSLVDLLDLVGSCSLDGLFSSLLSYPIIPYVNVFYFYIKFNLTLNWQYVVVAKSFRYPHLDIIDKGFQWRVNWWVHWKTVSRHSWYHFWGGSKIWPKQFKYPPPPPPTPDSP